VVAHGIMMLLLHQSHIVPELAYMTRAQVFSVVAASSPAAGLRGSLFFVMAMTWPAGLIGPAGRAHCLALVCSCVVRVVLGRPFVEAPWHHTTSAVRHLLCINVSQCHIGAHRHGMHVPSTAHYASTRY